MPWDLTQQLHPNTVVHAAEVWNIFQIPCPTPQKSNFQFQVTQATVEHNAQLLEPTNYDMVQLLATQKGMTADFGSKFSTGSPWNFPRINAM
jgi:hypothetical protein